MRVLIQRVKRASVTVDGELISEIAQGLLVLVGICDEDNNEDITSVVWSSLISCAFFISSARTAASAISFGVFIICNLLFPQHLSPLSLTGHNC